MAQQEAAPSQEKQQAMKVAVVGGGLVGALAACLLAQRGFEVSLFEGRHDGRREAAYYGRSINLAISHRGISALQRLGLERVVAERALPMRGRMIHDLRGRCSEQPYDPDGRCINSIERAGLNNFLLDQAEQRFGVKLLFDHKLVDMNGQTGQLWFRRRQPACQEQWQLLSYQFQLVLGCDGAKSTVRSLLSRQSELECSQRYIEHGYLELRMDAAPASEPVGEAAGEPVGEPVGDFKMSPNFLHIWPRGQFMMIALPNRDHSFTCTLFAPFERLRALREPQAGLAFFKQHFGDAVALIGAAKIQQTLAASRASPLVSIECRPYHLGARLALLGDAAHAMVPFYGQGMNCGFEDCLVLDECMDTFGVSGQLSEPELAEALAAALARYSELRCANGAAMCKLAMYNYVEMRDLVNSAAFRARKWLDGALYRLLGARWLPLYTMVTFSRIPVDECLRRRRRQDRLLARGLAAVGAAAALAAASLAALSWRVRAA